MNFRNELGIQTLQVVLQRMGYASKKDLDAKQKLAWKNIKWAANDMWQLSMAGTTSGSSLIGKYSWMLTSSLILSTNVCSLIFMMKAVYPSVLTLRSI